MKETQPLVNIFLSMVETQVHMGLGSKRRDGCSCKVWRTMFGFHTVRWTKGDKINYGSGFQLANLNLGLSYMFMVLIHSIV